MGYGNALLGEKKRNMEGSMEKIHCIFEMETTSMSLEI